jgi:hypothetical protein
MRKHVNALRWKNEGYVWRWRRWQPLWPPCSERLFVSFFHNIRVERAKFSTCQNRNLWAYLNIYLSVYRSVCLSVCLTVCLSSYISIHPAVCLSVCLSTCLTFCLSVFLSICLSICLSVCLSDCLSVCLPIYPSLCLSVCLSTCLTICLSVFLSIHLSAYLSVCLPVWLFVCLSSYLSIYPSVCLSVCLHVWLFVCLSSYLSIHLYIQLSACLSVYLSIYISIYLPTYLSTALQPFHWTYTVSRTPLTGDQHVGKPLPTHRTTQTQNKRTQTLIPGVGFEPTIPVFERAKTDHAVDRGATVIGIRNLLVYKYKHFRVRNHSILLPIRRKYKNVSSLWLNIEATNIH